uniref:Uncharacterized protein n=1 Tax=Anguilla anguilla TaxID=7936 RepID=A0A0E9QRG9_ANGAN
MISPCDYTIFTTAVLYYTDSLPE